MIEPKDGDVALALAGFAARAGEMTIHRGAVVFLVTLLRVQPICHERVAAGRIHQVAGVPALGAPILVHGLDPRAPAAVQQLNLAYPAPFDDERPGLGGAADQDLVEVRAPDLIGEGQGFVPGFREFELLPPPIPRRDEFGAPFLHADGPDPSATPSRSNNGRFAGKSDSPMWNRG